jgi:hypothetical protein
LIFDSEKKRFRSTENAEKVIEYDTLWREGERRLNSLRAEKTNYPNHSRKQSKKVTLRKSLLKVRKSLKRSRI